MSHSGFWGESSQSYAIKYTISCRAFFSLSPTYLSFIKQTFSTKQVQFLQILNLFVNSAKSQLPVLLGTLAISWIKGSHEEVRTILQGQSFITLWYQASSDSQSVDPFVVSGKQWFSKCGPQTSSSSITCKQGRNTNSQVRSGPNEFDLLELGTSALL